MLFPIKWQKGVNSVAFNGFDQLPTSFIAPAVNMTFYPSFVATNVALAGSDLSVNDTPLQTVKLATVMMQSRAQDAADDIGDFFQGDGTTFGGKAPMGLAGIVDDGTTLATYGGLSRATYPAALNATVTASTGTISLLKIRQLANAISDGRVQPTFAITTYEVWAFCEQLFQTFQRNTYTDFYNMNAGTGYGDPHRAGVGLIWDGLTIFKDRKIGAGLFYLLNLDYLKFYGLNWWKGTPVSLKSEYIKGNIYEYNPANATKAFTWTNWIQAYNQGAVNGFMILGGQLICTAPRRNGKLTGVTGI